MMSARENARALVMNIGSIPDSGAIYSAGSARPTTLPTHLAERQVTGPRRYGGGDVNMRLGSSSRPG